MIVAVEHRFFKGIILDFSFVKKGIYKVTGENGEVLFTNSMFIAKKHALKNQLPIQLTLF